MTLETLVQQHYDEMSASDHRIWQYISHNRERCRTLSLHQLADDCEVSHTTVLRFLQLLGMEGYSEFKVFLKWGEQSAPVIDERSVEKNSFDLSRTTDGIERMDCTELFQRLESAKNVYAYGSGSVQKAAAKVLKNYFILNEKLVHVIEGREERMMALLQMKAGDVIFLFSVSGNNPSMNAYASKLRERGLYLVSVCQGGANDLAKLCDFHLPFYTQRVDVGRHGLNYYSSAGMFLIVETLMLKYAAYQAAQQKRNNVRDGEP
ncbi:MAG: MurR/RpiR family transcriptional regulator [Butyricicoccus sp.]